MSDKSTFCCRKYKVSGEFFDVFILKVGASSGGNLKSNTETETSLSQTSSRFRMSKDWKTLQPFINTHRTLTINRLFRGFDQVVLTSPSTQ